MCPYGHVFVLVQLGLQGLRSSLTPKPYPSSRYRFGVWSHERGAAEHKNTCCVLVFGRDWAEEAPNTQNAPIGRILCVQVKENGPTVKTRPYGWVFTIGMKAEGQKMTPDTKNMCFSCWESVPGLPNMKMCPQGHDFMLDCT